LHLGVLEFALALAAPAPCFNHEACALCIGFVIEWWAVVVAIGLILRDLV